MNVLEKRRNQRLNGNKRRCDYLELTWMAEMGIYFIQDPDGYWLEVLPEK